MPTLHGVRSTGLIRRIDFTGQSGGGISAAALLALSSGGASIVRPSGARVQYGTSLVSAALSVNQLGLGRAFDADLIGASINPSRASNDYSQDMTTFAQGTGSTSTYPYSTAGYGPDGASYPSRVTVPNNGTATDRLAASIGPTAAGALFTLVLWCRTTSGSAGPNPNAYINCSGNTPLNNEIDFGGLSGTYIRKSK